MLKNIKEFISIINIFLGIPGKILAFISIISMAIQKITSIHYYIQINLYIFIPSIIILYILLNSFMIVIYPKIKIFIIKNYASKFWNEIKYSIREFNKTSDNNQQKKYDKIYKKNRILLQTLCVHYQSKIYDFYKERRPGALKAPMLVLNNFEDCFRANSLFEWSKYCTRNTDKEIDCFDEIPLIIEK